MRLTVKAASDRWPEDDVPCLIYLDDRNVESPWLNRELIGDAEVAFEEGDDDIRKALEKEKLTDGRKLPPGKVRRALKLIAEVRQHGDKRREQTA